MARFPVWLLIAAGSLLSACGTSDDPPPIVLITLESLRSDHVGSYGYDLDTTPALDRLASQATRFEQAYSVTSWTLPAHASLLTGLYPSAHGVSRPRDRLSDGHTTLAEALAAEGYQTAAVVSGPYLSRRTRLDQGFEHYDDSPITPPGGSPADDRTNPRMEQAITTFLDAGRDPERPLFLFLYFWDPHHLYLPPAPFDAMFVPEGAVPPAKLRFDPGFRLDRDITVPELAHVISQYDGEIRATDELLGRVWQKLEALGLWDAAAIFVTADHGEEFYDHGLISHKNHVYEEVVKVPLLLKAPGQREPLRDPRPVSHVDVFATALELAGSSRSAPEGGVSLLRPGPRPPVFFELVTDWWFDEPAGGRRHETRIWTAMREGSHKLVEVQGDRGLTQVLFDLERDPDEREPTPLDEAAGASRLRAQLGGWRASNATLAGAVPRAAQSELSEEEEEQLRTLGYLP